MTMSPLPKQLLKMVYDRPMLNIDKRGMICCGCYQPWAGSTCNLRLVLVLVLVTLFSRTSKAFSNKQTVKQCGCTEVYRDCMQTFLPALSCPTQRGVLRSSVRSFLHRMIICLEEEVLPFIPAASEHMLKDCEAKDLQEFIPLISQMTAKFKVCWGTGLTLSTSAAAI